MEKGLDTIPASWKTGRLGLTPWSGIKILWSLAHFHFCDSLDGEDSKIGSASLSAYMWSPHVAGLITIQWHLGDKTSEFQQEKRIRIQFSDLALGLQCHSHSILWVVSEPSQSQQEEPKYQLSIL